MWVASDMNQFSKINSGVNLMISDIEGHSKSKKYAMHLGNEHVDQNDHT